MPVKWAVEQHYLAGRHLVLVVTEKHSVQGVSKYARIITHSLVDLMINFLKQKKSKVRDGWVMVQSFLVNLGYPVFQM